MCFKCPLVKSNWTGLNWRSVAYGLQVDPPRSLYSVFCKQSHFLQVYSYEELKTTNYKLPKGVDKTKLEVRDRFLVVASAACSYTGNPQSVSKVMTHLTVFGEFSSIPNLGKTSPPSPLHNVDQTRNDHSAGKSDQHWLGGRGEIWQTLFFFSCGATFIKKIPKFCRVCHEFCNRLSEMVRGGSHEKYSVHRFGILTSDVVSLFASFHTISGAIH